MITHGGKVVNQAVARLLPAQPPPREASPMSAALLTDLTIFVLAFLIGFEVIGKVPPRSTRR